MDQAADRLDRDDLASADGAVADSLAVAAWTVISRVTGVLRGILVASVLGATFLANSYQFTNSLPNLVFYGLLAGSLFSSLLVPALVRHLDADDLPAAARVAGGLLGVVVAAMVVVVPLAVLTAPLALQLASGHSASADASGQARVAGLLALMLMPQVPLYGVIGTATAVMNAQRRFALAAAAPALENLGTMLVMGVVAVRYPAARSVSGAPLGLLLWLGLGTTAAVALHAAVQWWGARRVGVTLLPRAGWRHPEVRVLIRRAGPSLVQAGLGAVQILVLILLANRLAGGVVGLQLALNFYFLPVAIGATPVALSLIPRLSRMTGERDGVVFRDTLARGLAFALFLVVPAAAGYLALAGPLSRALAFGAFRAGDGAPLVAASLLGLAVGVVGETVFLIATYACYARGDTVTPLRAAVLQTAVCLTAAAASSTLTGPRSLTGLGLSLSLGGLAGSALLLTTLLRSLPRGEESIVRSAGRSVLSAAVMAGPAAATSAAAGRLAVPGAALIAAGLGVLAGAVVYFAAQLLLGAPELGWVRRATGRRGGAAPPRPRRVRRLRARRVRRLRGMRGEGLARLARLTRDVALVGLCLGIGVLLAASPVRAVLLLVVLGVSMLVWARPVWAVYALVVVTPLTAGIDRGTLIPALRPNEAVLFLLAGVLALRGLVRVRSGEVRLPRLSAVELGLLAMAVTSSVFPLLMMVARRRQVSADDLSYVLVLWKLLVLYALVRWTVRTVREVERTLWIGMAAGALVSGIAVLQSLKLLGVQTLLAHYYSPFGVGSALQIGRGSSTLSLPAAVADLATLNLMVSLGLLVRGSRRRVLLVGSALLSVFGVMAAAEFSTLLGMMVALVAFVLVTSYRRLLAYAVPVGLVGYVLLEPVIANRLKGFQSASGFPVSWLGRLRNLQNYFWPELTSNWNWVLGVRPSARVPAVSQEFGWIWIESGYTWLLWGGGLPLLAAYLAFAVASWRRGRSLVGARSDALAVTGMALASVVAADVVVMFFDPHITYRGAAEALLVLVALSHVPDRRAPEPSGAAQAGAPVAAATRARIPQPRALPTHARALPTHARVEAFHSRPGTRPGEPW